MIGLLAVRPLRLANLVQLELGRELMQRGGGWWQTGEPLELPFPDDLVSALESYLATWRPRLAQRALCARHPPARH